MVYYNMIQFKNFTGNTINKKRNIERDMYMARIFYPRKSIMVAASEPHPEGTEYKISLGDEEWSGVYHSVIKIQMVYDGRVAGRKSPSYPSDSDDYLRVSQAIQDLLGKKAE